MLAIWVFLSLVTSQIAVTGAVFEPQHTVVIRVTIAPDPSNVWLCTQFKSLSENWTPRHCSPIAPTDKQVVDRWPRMLPSRYNVTAELFRDVAGKVTEFDSAVYPVEVK